MNRLLVVLSVGTLACSVAAGGGKKNLPYEEPLAETAIAEGISGPRISEPDWSSMRPMVGTFTTLSGFYDYQANWGAVQQIRVNPSNGNIHVTYFTSLDSINPSGNLRTRVLVSQLSHT